MALRADAIRLPRGSPLGAATLGDLADDDLIVITGSNGAGKSTLLEPLRKSGRAGEVVCIDSATRAASIYGSQGVQQSITFLESTDLMAEFIDLTQALALASSATRLQDEARLLKQLQNDLQRLASAAIGGVPARLESLSQNYLQSDAACGDRPRTPEAYDEIGSRLAVRRGLAWRRPDLHGDAAARVQAEQAVRPEARSLSGMSDLRPCLGKLKAMPLPDPARPSAVARLRTAEERLDSAIDLALRLVPAAPAPDVALAPATRADAVVVILREAYASLQKALAAKDLLRSCRLNALNFIHGEAAALKPVTSCPVCDAPVDAARLSVDLDHRTAGGDEESDGWIRQMKEMESAAKELKGLMEDVQAEARLASSEHQRIRDAIVPSAPGLRPAAGWAPSVSAAADEIRAGCEAWVREHAANPGVAAIDAARSLGANAARSQEQLETEERALNGDLPDAQADFRAMQALGAALSARAELDALEWTARLDEIDADRRASEQRDLWIKVLREMSDAREAEAALANTQVVQDPGVQARFGQMLARVQSRHPTLVGLGYFGDSVQANGQDRSKALSEGQRVIVNIAAALAVVGKVAGSGAHKPGWIAFDEPSNGLDEASRAAVADHLGGLSTQEVPSQIFVATFDQAFADRLIAAGKAAGRRVKHVALPDHQPGRAFNPSIRTP